jgi:hypothetical protein
MHHISSSPKTVLALVESFISSQHDETTPPHGNGVIHISSLILTDVVACKAEAELSVLFYNAQDACSLRSTVEALGHIKHLLPSRLKLIVLLSLPLALSSNTRPKPWNSASTWPVNASISSDLLSIGDQYPQIRLTTSPSITHQAITSC